MNSTWHSLTSPSSELNQAIINIIEYVQRESQCANTQLGEKEHRKFFPRYILSCWKNKNYTHVKKKWWF